MKTNKKGWILAIKINNKTEFFIFPTKKGALETAKEAEKKMKLTQWAIAKEK